LRRETKSDLVIIESGGFCGRLPLRIVRVRKTVRNVRVIRE
jgi:hypothetical protein